MVSDPTITSIIRRFSNKTISKISATNTYNLKTYLKPLVIRSNNFTKLYCIIAVEELDNTPCIATQS